MNVRSPVLFVAALLTCSVAACSGATPTPHLAGDAAPSVLQGCWRLQGGAEKGKPVGYRVPLVMTEGTVYCFDEEGYVVIAPSGHRDRVQARWRQVEAGRWSSVEAPRRVFALDALVPGAEVVRKTVQEQGLGDICTINPSACPDELAERSVIFDPQSGTLDPFDGPVPVDRVEDDAAMWSGAASLPALSEVQRLERACHEEVMTQAMAQCADIATEHRRCGGLATCRVQAQRHERLASQCAVEPTPAPCRRVMALTQALLP